MKRDLLRTGLLAALAIAGCHSYSGDITGNYKSVEYGFIAQNYLSFFENTTYVLRSSLKINADSTYVLQNCGNIEEGKWQVQHDSLLLFCEQNRWRIDSFNKTGFEDKFLDCGAGRPGVFLMDKNILKQEWKHKDRTVLNYFEKRK